MQIHLLLCRGACICGPSSVLSRPCHRARNSIQPKRSFRRSNATCAPWSTSAARDASRTGPARTLRPHGAPRRPESRSGRLRAPAAARGCRSRRRGRRGRPRPVRGRRRPRAAPRRRGQTPRPPGPQDRRHRRGEADWIQFARVWDPRWARCARVQGSERVLGSHFDDDEPEIDEGGGAWLR